LAFLYSGGVEMTAARDGLVRPCEFVGGGQAF
jgi:hypothetical protein